MKTFEEEECSSVADSLATESELSEVSLDARDNSMDISTGEQSDDEQSESVDDSFHDARKEESSDNVEKGEEQREQTPQGGGADDVSDRQGEGQGEESESEEEEEEEEEEETAFPDTSIQLQHVKGSK